MSDIRDLETAASSSILQLIPLELWSKILDTEHGFTVADFKTLCFVASYFKTICQPLVYKSLAVRGAKVTHEYSFETGRGNGETTHAVDQWKRDVAGLIRAERRLRLVGDDPSLSTFPKVISIGVMPGSGTPSLSAQQIPTTKLSKTAYGIFSQFRTTLLRTLPLFIRLRRLEIGLFPIGDGILDTIASHPTLYELKLGACSFSSLTFPIPSIRSLELDKVSQEQAPAAFRLASSHHLEELRIKNMEVSAILEGLRARPESESKFTKLHRLTIVPTGTTLNLVDVEPLLSSFPVLRQLDVGEATITVPEGGQAMKPSTIPYLQQFSGPLPLARFVVPGRPVSDIRCGDGRSVPFQFAETRGELQMYLNPLRLSTHGAGGITTLHLPNHKIAPIWLLSRFVAETFPRLVDLRLPVRGLIKPEYAGWDDGYPIRSCCGFRGYRRHRGVEGRPFEEGKVEGMVNDIRDSVENELVGAFDDQYNQANGVDYSMKRVSSPPAPLPTPVSSLDVDIVATLAKFCNDVVIDKAGVPSRYPKDYPVRRFALSWPSYLSVIRKRLFT
jgi:hypothetical protein